MFGHSKAFQLITRGIRPPLNRIRSDHHLSVYLSLLSFFFSAFHLSVWRVVDLVVGSVCVCVCVLCLCDEKQEEEGKCGEGKCGEGEDKGEEGKCGEGKCGS